MAELEESRRRLAAATDEERRRIERDLHDGAQQQLLALIAHAELARASTDPEDREAALDRVADLASGAYSTVRQVSQGVRPPMLDDLGLAAAIREVAERLPMPVRLELSEPDARLDPEVESAALFFVTEALANILKHAGRSCRGPHGRGPGRVAHRGRGRRLRAVRTRPAPASAASATASRPSVARS